MLEISERKKAGEKKGTDGVQGKGGVKRQRGTKVCEC